jgi:drug/metabolite transporter (DMT)-like permease
VIRFGAPLLFVLIWSTGFVVARVAAPRADLLSASYWAIGRGLAVGVMALLGALQPLFTALFLVATGRTMLAARTRSGLLIGFGGVGLVLAPSLSNEGVGLSGLTVGAALLSVVAVTAGTLFQKWLATT